MLRRAALMAADTLTSAGVSGGVIQDSWDKIIEIAQAGRASDFYSVGNKKSLSWGTLGTLTMILVGINVDTKSDGTGKANMTWMAASPLSKKLYQDPGSFCEIEETSLFYQGSYISSYTEGLINYLSESIQNAILRVKKTYTTTTARTNKNDKSVTPTTSTMNCKVWIPSLREFGLSTPASGTPMASAEASGPVYSLKVSQFSFPSYSPISSVVYYGNIFLRTWIGVTAKTNSNYDQRYWGLAQVRIRSNAFDATGYLSFKDDDTARFKEESLGYILPCFCL